MPGSLRPLPSTQPFLKSQRPDFSLEAARLLGRLKTVTYQDRKDRNPDRIPGTCEWFVSHRLFNRWLTGSKGEDCQALWVSADPGCGKSVLAKHLVDHVLPSTQSRTTCYFFFKDDFEDQKSVVNAMCCILHQLFTENPILFSAKVHAQLEAEGEKLTVSFGTLWELLLQVAREKNAGEIICILDALDECAENDRQLLARALLDQHRTKKAPNLKFLLTSRPFGSIRRDFQPSDTADLAVVHLSGESEDEMKQISREIDIFIAARVQGVGAKLKLDKDEQDMLLRGLLSVPHRTYLWVYLTLDHVENSEYINKRKIREALSRLPNSVDEAYEKILNASANPKEARRALHIIVTAERPLTVHEMNFALAIRPSHQSYQDVELDSDERFPERLRNICGLFVIVIDLKIYLLHQTAKEFLVMADSQQRPPKAPGQRPTKSVWKHSLKPVESHQILGEICLWNLRFSDLCNTPELPKLRGYHSNYSFQADRLLREYQFLEYSAYFWAVHLRELHTEADKEITQAMLEICHQHHQWWFRDMVGEASHANSSFRSSITDDFTTTPLMVASYFGLVPVVQVLVKTKGCRLSARDSEGRTALAWAAACGHADVVRVLIDGQPRVFRDLGWLGTWNPSIINARDDRHRTPLHWAAEAGWEAVVRLLLDNGAGVDVRNKVDETPLLLACAQEKTGVIQLLLERGAHVEVRSYSGVSPLMEASKHGTVDAMRLLLQFGADVNGRESWQGMTPLMFAVKDQSGDKAKFLLENGADMEAKNRENHTAFTLACEAGMLNTAKVLLRRGANIEHENNVGMSALSCASRAGRDAVVKLLVEQGADIKSKCNDGWTPLHYCMDFYDHRKCLSIAKFLLDNGADLEARDRDGASILAQLARSGMDRCVKWMIDNGANIEAQNVYGETPLMLASKLRLVDTVWALIQAGANINVTALDGRSVLQLIIGSYGSSTLVEWLLDHGIDIEHRDKQGRTALSHAASGYGEMAVTMVDMLLKKGADIHSKDNQRRTPLFWATANPTGTAIAHMLTKHGAVTMDDVDTKMALSLAHDARERTRKYAVRRTRRRGGLFG
jgi:ankyrin repeat protein